MAANVEQPQIPQIPEGEKKKQTWTEYGKEVYNEQYERWMPWIEDFYLRWFTKDNKASYATKGIVFAVVFPTHPPSPSPDCPFLRDENTSKISRN